MSNTNQPFIEVQEEEIKEVAIADNATYTMMRTNLDAQLEQAKRYPRSITRFMQEATTLATYDEDIASSCTYSLPRGGKKIEGGSIRFAEIIATSYTNINYASRVVSNDGKKITAIGVCIDLQSNISCAIEVSRKITDRNGIPYNEDMQVLTGNAATSIAMRNAIFRVVPTSFVNKIYEKVKEVAIGTAETVINRRNKAIAYFQKFGVTEKQICEALQINGIEDINLESLYTLSGMKSAHHNGESTIKDLFEPDKSNIPDDVKNAQEDALNKLKNSGKK
jgi:hypothetical protein